MKFYISAFIIVLLITIGSILLINKAVNKTVEDTAPILSPFDSIATNKPIVKKDTVNFDDVLDTFNYEIKDGYYQIGWKDLARVKFEDKYNDSISSIVAYPIFHPSIKKLNGQKVEIKGYVIPIEETGDESIFILSAFPYSNCFFCGMAGPESVMDIKLAKKYRKRYTKDDLSSFKGKLKLNDTDLYYLNYILEDAKPAN